MSGENRAASAEDVVKTQQIACGVALTWNLRRRHARGDLLEDRTKHLARPTPVGPVVQEHDVVALDGLLEVISGYLNGAHVVLHLRSPLYPSRATLTVQVAS